MADDLQSSLVEGSNWRKTSTIIGFVLLCAAMIAVVAVVRHRMKREGAYRTEYSGRVTDKWITYDESETGTRMRGHLLIKATNGEVFPVTVGPEFYQQTKIGSWVIKDREGLRTLPEQP